MTNNKKKNVSKKKTINNKKKTKKIATLDDYKIFIYSIIFIIGLSLGITIGIIGNIQKKQNNNLYYNFSLDVKKNNNCNQNFDLYYQLEDGRNIYTYCLNNIKIKNNNSPLKYLELALDKDTNLIDNLINNLKEVKQINDGGTTIYETNNSRVHTNTEVKVISCHHTIGTNKLFNKDIYIGPSDMPLDNICENTSIDKNINYEYDCSFTKTYNIVNLLSNYKYDDNNYSYIVVNAFQDNAAKTLLIPIKIKNKLKVNTNYEFTYTIKGKVNHELSIDELMTYMINNNEDLKVTLAVNKTNKTGLNQKNESICRYKRSV